MIKSIVILVLYYSVLTYILRKMNVPIILIILLYIYIIKPRRNSINIENYFKTKYLKKNRIEIDKKNIFIIKKEDVDDDQSILLTGEKIIHYPSMKPHMIDVGDVILEGNENKNMVIRFLEFVLESPTVHVLSVSNFKIDRNKKDIPEGYYLINPIIIDARLRSGTSESSLYDYVLEESQKARKIFHCLRYKNLNIEQKKKFFHLFIDYKFSYYNIATYIKYPIVKSIELFYIILQKILNLDYYYSKKLFYSTIIYLLGKVDVNYPLTPEKLKNIDFLIKFNFSKLKNEIDINKRTEIIDLIKKLTILKYRIREEKNFVCSSFIYYYFNRVGLDLFNNDSFGIDKINFSQFVYPNMLDELIHDSRFKYISSIYTGKNW